MGKRSENIKKSIIKTFKKNYAGYICVMPVILGVIIFTLYPVFSSLVYSFHDYNILRPMGNPGFQNYVYAFTRGYPKFSQSFKVTVTYSIIMIPFMLFGSMFIAMLLNNKLKGINLLKLFIYLPVLIPTVASGLIWKSVANMDYGLGNAIITGIGFKPYTFLNNAESSLPSFIVFSLFGIGANMLLWLAALKGVPSSMYEAASIEGANGFDKFKKITLPMCTPYILYILITSIIAMFQTFGSVYVIASETAGKGDSLLFYVVNIYFEAFTNFNIGYASALSWILFIFIGILSFVLFKTSKWVFYSEES